MQVAGKKIAGILVESQIATDSTGFAIVGIGLNVNLTPGSVEGIAATATSLAALRGAPMDLNYVEETLFRKLEAILGDLADSSGKVINRWRTHLTTLGQQIAVRTRNGVVEGVAVDVDQQGALLLRSAGGVTHRLLDGDVSLQS